MTNDDKILKLLGGLATNVATILEEQQAQRSDIRSLHRDVGVLKQDVGVLKQDVTIIKQTMATKADIAKKFRSHEHRLANLEEHAGIPDPTKH